MPDTERIAGNAASWYRCPYFGTRLLTLYLSDNRTGLNLVAQIPGLPEILERLVEKYGEL